MRFEKGRGQGIGGLECARRPVFSMLTAVTMIDALELHERKRMQEQLPSKTAESFKYEDTVSPPFA